MSEPRLIRLLIAEDHTIVREGLAAVLNQQPDMSVVAEASNGAEAVTLFLRHKPDVTLMDLYMPAGDGLAAIQEIRRQAPNACIIVLSAYEGDEDVFQALKAGAKAYVPKTAPRTELLDAIRAVSAGKTTFSPHVAAQLAERLHSRPLTNREREVLEFIARGRSNQEIGNALFITEGTVKAHVNSILSKLHVSDRTQAILVAVKRGLIHMN